MEAEKANFPIAMMCRQLAVSRSGYYAWAKRRPSARQKEDSVLVSEIKTIHEKSRQTYGSPRIVHCLNACGFDVSRRRVARLMHKEGIAGTPIKPFKRTTDSAQSNRVENNILNRDFSPKAPNRIWATDVTYIRTWQGWLYLAVVIDLYSRRVVGWSMATHMRTELVLDALTMALGRRLPQGNLLHHSDRGSQYTSDDYRVALRENGLICSMSRKGNCWDNSVVESFFATLKKDLIHRHPWPTLHAARSAIADYIEGFYNCDRCHSTLNYLSPLNFERQFETTEATLAA